MGMKKAWIYDSALPAALSEELRNDGFERSPSFVRRASFDEKHATLERYSISASGDLESVGVYEWPRVSVAARARELKMRTKKMNSKNRRFSAPAPSRVDEDAKKQARRLSDFGEWPNVDRARYGEEGEDKQASKTLTSSTPRKSTAEHKRTVSEPIIINTVDDLLKYLEKIGRLQPPLPSFSTPPKPVSAARSVSGSDTECESGDSSFVSQLSTESDGTVCDAEPVTAEVKAKDYESAADAAEAECLVPIGNSLNPLTGQGKEAALRCL